MLALRGPSVWANFPVLEAWVDLGELDKPSTEFPGFTDRLMGWMPTMIEHRCSIGQRGGFFQRLRTGTYLGHILEHVTLELQTLAGTEVGFGKARETSEQGVYKVIVEYIEETRGPRVSCRRHANFAWRPCSIGPSTSPAQIERLRNLAQEVCLGPSTRAIVEAAAARHIPYRRLNTDSLVLFGHGRKQRRIQAAETDRTGAIAEAIAQDKEMTRTLAPRRGRADAVRPARQGRRGRLGRGHRDRRAGGRQAAGRKPGPRRGHQPHDRRAGGQGLRGGPAGERIDSRREVHSRPRLSPAGRGRPGGGRGPPRARPGPRRRRAHRRPTGRSGQRRSPPRRTPRHGAQQDQARRHRLGGAGRSGLHARVGSAGRARWC